MAAENTALLILNLHLYIKIYWNSKQLFKIVVIFRNIPVLLYFLSNKRSLGEHKR